MSQLIYGVYDKNYDLFDVSDTTEDKNLYDTYYRVESIGKEFDLMLKQKYNELSEEDERSFSEFEDDYIDEYFPDSDYFHYAELSKKASLRDICFNEKKWQDIMVYFDRSYNFPAKNLCLVSIEESNDNSMQRVDLLYLRSDGRVIPAEIKISDNGKDVHGQIIRYMAGFAEDEFDIASIIQKAKNKIPSNIKTIMSFIDNNNLHNKKIVPIDTSGILICENYHIDTITAIRYLNEKTNLDIKMFDIDLLVASNWNKDTERFIFKIQLNEVVW